MAAGDAYRIYMSVYWTLLGANKGLSRAQHQAIFLNQFWFIFLLQTLEPIHTQCFD